jgi:hypothetical protein
MSIKSFYDHLHSLSKELLIETLIQQSRNRYTFQLERYEPYKGAEMGSGDKRTHLCVFKENKRFFVVDFSIGKEYIDVLQKFIGICSGELEWDQLKWNDCIEIGGPDYGVMYQISLATKDDHKYLSIYEGRFGIRPESVSFELLLPFEECDILSLRSCLEETLAIYQKWQG